MGVLSEVPTTGAHFQGGWKAPACALCLAVLQLGYIIPNPEALLPKN